MNEPNTLDTMIETAITGSASAEEKADNKNDISPEPKENAVLDQDEPKSDEAIAPEGDGDIIDDGHVEETAKAIAEEIINAPDQWSGFAKTKFKMLPKDVQKELTDYYSKVEQQGKVYNALDESLGDVKQQAIATYGSIEGMFKHYVNLDKFAAADPVGLVKWFCQQRGINPHEIFGGRASPEANDPQGQPQADDPIRKELAELRQIVSGQKNQEMTHLELEAARQIEAFSKDPKYPFFNDLRADIGLLIETGKAKDLAEAYEKAMRLNDRTNEVYIQEQIKKHNELNLAKARKAKQAATVKGANGHAVGKKTTGGHSLDRILDEAMSDRL